MKTTNSFERRVNVHHKDNSVSIQTIGGAMSYDLEGAWLYNINKYARHSIKGLSYEQLAKKYIELVTEVALNRRDMEHHFYKVETITGYPGGE